MAARLSKHHSELVRAKIQASVILDRLHRCVSGEVEMTAVQLGAANSLLDRAVPKLSQIQHVGDSDNPIQAKVIVEFIGQAAGSVSLPVESKG